MPTDAQHGGDAHASVNLTRMANRAEQWMAREKWDALVRGEDCPLCLPSTYLIAELRVSRLVLARNQAVKGYCIAIYAEHVREPYELGVEQRTSFWEDVLEAGAALEKLFGADKMNFEMLGNGVPHLHCHIKPRYYGDQWPSCPVPFDEEPVVLTSDEYEGRAHLIRETLQARYLRGEQRDVLNDRK